MALTAVAVEQPELVELVPANRRDAAVAAAVARVVTVAQGPWVPDDERAPGAHFGLLVLDGLLAREVHVGDRACVELLGAGDLLRPWAPLREGSSIAVDARWEARTDLRLAVLDRAFALRIAGFPEIAAALMDRLVRRSHWLAFDLAVHHIHSLETRLRVMFWYMADRWGRVTEDGIVLPLQLTHGLLGELVGARRPAITTALGRLAAAGVVQREPDGSWRLRGDAPPELHAAQAGAAGLAP